MNFKNCKKIYIALLEDEIIHRKGGEMDFPCSVNTSMYATICRTKNVTLLSTNDKIMPLWNSLHQLSLLKLMATFKFPYNYTADPDAIQQRP